MLQHSVFWPKEKIKRYDLVSFCNQSLQNWTEKDCCYLPANHMWNTWREDLPQADLQRCSDEADHRLVQESLQVKPKRSFYFRGEFQLVMCLFYSIISWHTVSRSFRALFFSAFCLIVCYVSISCNVFSVFYLTVCYVSLAHCFVCVLFVCYVSIQRTVFTVFDCMLH